MKKAGALKMHPSNVIQTSYVSIGFECLDRDLFNPEKCYDLLGKTGVKYARCQTGWAKCERQKGVYSFDWLDAVVDNLLCRGISPWFNVGFGNPLYMDNLPNPTGVGCVPLYYGEECITAWEKYVGALAAHFKDRVSCFEIWNEADISHFWYPKAPDAAAYAQLIKLTAVQLRRHIPDCKTGACIASLNTFGYTGQLLQHLEKEDIDFFSYHIYTTVPEYRYADLLQQLKRMLHARGLDHVELWQGEGGYPSWAYKGHWLVKDGCNSERTQAVWQLRRYFLDVYNGVKRSSFFQMADMWEKPYVKATEVLEKPAAHGVLNGITYTPKVSYTTISTLAAIFSGNIVPADAYISVNIPQGSVFELLSCMKFSFVKNGMPVFAYYMPTEVSDDSDIDGTVTVTVYDAPADPVLIDTYTAEVFTLEEISHASGMTVYKNLPLKPYPLMLTDRAAFDWV